MASPPDLDEARQDRWRSNRRMQPSDLPGWLGTARVERSAEEPGRPCRAEAEATSAPWEYITAGRPGRESERPILAEKRGNARGAKGPY